MRTTLHGCCWLLQLPWCGRSPTATRVSAQTVESPWPGHGAQAVWLKINDLYGVYVDSHLSFGTAHIGAASGVTGNLAIALMGERSLPGRTFIAAGGGYGVLNNPSGPLAQARLGWYPMEHDDSGVGRRLNIALDARWYFAGDQIGTVTQVALTLGYDRF